MRLFGKWKINSLILNFIGIHLEKFIKKKWKKWHSKRLKEQNRTERPLIMKVSWCHF